MSVTITSTTGSASDLNQAAEMYGDQLVTPAQDPPGAADKADEGGSGHAVVTSEDGKVATTTGTKEECEEAASDLAEEHQAKAEVFVGKTRGKLLRRLSRLHEQNEQLLTRLAKYEPGPQVQPQQNADGQQPRQDLELQNDNGRQEPQQQQSQPPPQLNEEQLRQFQLRQFQAEASYPYRLELAKAKYPDLEATLNQDIQLPIWVMDALRTEEDGIDVTYYLGKHPEIAKDITKASESGNQRQAASMLDQISNGLRFQAQNQQPRRKPRSAAPPPIVPVRGNSLRESGNPSEMEYRDYVKWYRQKYGR